MTKRAESNAALKRWRFFAVFWPLLCLAFAGIIVCQTSRQPEERLADVALTIIPLIFFAIGMTIRRRLLQERGNATVLTTATVVSQGRRMRTGKNTVFYPEFEFQVDGVTRRVKSRGGSGLHRVTEGLQVELYYDPQNPDLFYVPILRWIDRLRSALLCGIGVAFPLLALCAPLLRAFVSSLP